MAVVKIQIKVARGAFRVLCIATLLRTAVCHVITESVFQSGKDGSSDSSRVVVFHVFRGCQRRARSSRRFVRQGEDLEARAVESNEIHVDERVTGGDVVVKGEGENGADGVIAVEADTFAIGGEDEEDIKSELVTGEYLEETIAEEAV